ncbi:kinase-like protein TMKL1-like, partial [Trifolium medium]|nr:kinase-like protein TMKL1-like [Trifolium medium]
MLKSVYLNINSLSGTIPLELGYGSSLDDIDFSDNLLSGVLPPSIWNLCDKLVSLKIHGNLLSGSVSEPALPDSSCKFLKFLDLGGNSPDLCGSPLKSCSKNSSLSSGAVAGIVISLMTGAVVLASLLIGYMQNKKKKGSGESEDELNDEE